jgi:acetoin utilization protein AcuB
MNMMVEEFTSPVLVTIGPEASLDQAIEMLQENGIRHLPVVENGDVVGVISERDLLFHVGKNWSEMKRVGDVMISDVLTVHRHDPLSEVAFELSSHKVGSAIVLDDSDTLYGIFTTTDALNALVEVLNNKS